MKKFLRAMAFLAPICGFALLASMPAGGQEKKKEMMPIQQGVAYLAPTKGQDVYGVVLFDQKDGFVHVTGKVSKLTPGKHGFHIHEFGDLRSPDGLSTGGHYNPDGVKHGGPDDKEHHDGDLGNIVADEKGDATVDVKAKGLKVHYLLGRGLVVHAKEDDLKTQPTGDAGGRVSVGVIGIAMPPKK